MSSRKNPWNLSSFERFMVIIIADSFLRDIYLGFFVGGQKIWGLLGDLFTPVSDSKRKPSFCDFLTRFKKSMLWKQTSKKLLQHFPWGWV